MLIRREEPTDAPAVHAVTAAAFAKPDIPVAVEATLVDQLRTCDSWLPALSLVAIGDREEIIGHVVRTLTTYQPALQGSFTYAEPFNRL
jgi:putative acetyltransferase